MNFFNNTNCGGNGFHGMEGGCEPCTLLIWILILQCFCGNHGGMEIDLCTLLLLLVILGGCGCNK